MRIYLGAFEVFYLVRPYNAGSAESAGTKGVIAQRRSRDSRQSRV
jgi:hypothetical protein